MEPYCTVDTKKITSCYTKWKQWLPEVNMYYAVKCNPHPKIIEHVHSLGVKFDCASKKEIEDVLGIASSSDILFANPIKLPHHITYAKENQIPVLVFDSINELLKIKEYYPTASLLLRIAVRNTGFSQLSKKFGIEILDVPLLLYKAKNLNMNVIGFSFHVGSPCIEPCLYYEALNLCKIACDIASEFDMPITTIDIGGGFQENTFEACASEVRRGMKLFTNKIFISEVGRYLVESSHRLHVHVIGKKKKGEVRIYYLNDGLYGTFSCTLFDHAKPLLQSDREGPYWPSIVYGPTCDSFDMIDDKAKLPELEIGDCLYVDNYGAYTLASCFNGYEMKHFIYI